MLRMSRLLVRTLREDPADAEVASHRLLVRAGYIRRAAPGGYVLLPLGKLVLDQVTRVVREELATIGAQEVSFPALLPREPYERSGRWDEYGEDVFRLTDRRGTGYLLAPTHEELFAILVRDLCGSYRDYPLILFQVQTKYRDETRPRGGLLRGREFLMKDSYSFDLSDAGLEASYAAHREAYQRIFDRLGLRYAIAAAASGAMGGAVSEEFLAETPAGEDTYAACPGCGYAANVEALVTPPPAAVERDRPALTVLDTPDTPTIDTLVARLNAIRAGGRDDWRAADTLKNVALTVDGELVVVGVPGDREVDLKRVEAVLFPARVAMFEDFASRPDLVRGYLGPQGSWKARYLVDPRVVTGTAWATGANEPGRHAIDVVCGRDFVPDGTIEAATVRAGDPCPRCGTGLELRRGVEIGQIFQLGRRFADVFGLDASGPDGTPIRITMGSYGIGLSRAVATIVEQHHDERGLVWPAEVAPAHVHVVPLRDPAPALDLGARLSGSGAGLRVLVDDRPGLSAGVRFADAELLGMPYTVVLGRRFADGYVELRNRATGEHRDVPVEELTTWLV
ncbi:MAG: proline--tRNA ligase [Actinobacteria bacterium 13_2_20CM_2_72_6]|nr:MAG: proline--tRNA ligase [Actinobacteria bacterium 13_2_20CM_2_72_6]